MNMHKATYNLPEEVLNELNTFVEQRQRSRFVTEAIKMALEIEKKRLEEAYIEAARDDKRNQELEEWSVLDTEGWDE